MENYDIETSKKYESQLADVFEYFVEPTTLIERCTIILESNNFKQLIDENIFPESWSYIPFMDGYKYEIMLNAAVLHWYDSFKPQDYLSHETDSQITERVCDQMKLRSLLNASEILVPYAHIPIVYSLHCLVNFTYRVLENYANDNPDYKNDIVVDCDIASLRQILLELQSILGQVENRNFLGAYSSLRTLIEEYYIYLAIKGNPIAINEYNFFTETQKNFENTHRFDKEFRSTVPKGKNPVQYIQYGWLRVLDAEPKNMYRFKDVIKHAPLHEKNKEIDDKRYELYAKWSKNVHGEILDVVNPDITEILSIISYVESLACEISELFMNTFNCFPVYQGIDLIELVKDKRKEMYEIIDTSILFSNN